MMRADTITSSGCNETLQPEDRVCSIQLDLFPPQILRIKQGTHFLDPLSYFSGEWSEPKECHT